MLKIQSNPSPIQFCIFPTKISIGGSGRIRVTHPFLIFGTGTRRFSFGWVDVKIIFQILDLMLKLRQAAVEINKPSKQLLPHGFDVLMAKGCRWDGNQKICGRLWLASFWFSIFAVTQISLLSIFKQPNFLKFPRPSNFLSSDFWKEHHLINFTVRISSSPRNSAKQYHEVQFKNIISYGTEILAFTIRHFVCSEVQGQPSSNVIDQNFITPIASSSHIQRPNNCEATICLLIVDILNWWTDLTD